MTAEILFWPALAVAAWAYAGYPLATIARARRRGREPRSGAIRPAVTVVIAARNESKTITARVANILMADYPGDRLEVCVVDDGSDDDTGAQAASSGDARVRVIRLAKPGGKAVALNRALETVETPLTVFADARQRFAPETVAELVAPFAESAVGAVSGTLVFEAAADGAGEAGGAYWRLERALRQAEARLGQAHGVSGAVYAIRTRLFEPMPPGLVLDDVFVPLVIVRQGYRVWVAPRAIATDIATASAGLEFRRKLRTLTGNWQLIAALPWLLDPRANPVFGAWLSHKFARLIAPWALLSTLFAAAAGTGAFMALAFWAQLAGYIVAAGALVLPRSVGRLPLAGAAGSFVLLNAAALASLPTWLCTRDPARLWQR